jgi:hypothetical protein
VIWQLYHAASPKPLNSDRARGRPLGMEAWINAPGTIMDIKWLHRNQLTCCFWGTVIVMLPVRPSSSCPQLGL